ncbi:PQQ-dependent sugar dehydrogenase [Sphingomonas sp. HMP6]|uniref:PQQ-dependent sugar dehydrogenase n=1 Tax=Sphingomonas sp. HMP6 TaxID=1517551 RepID=UPI0015964BEC|nr:sorbosone dehydrogenase family protein [Sphingomonas sp. HMP6]BCA60627.1 sorbosone dehydrogenase [Sphingomonas sp. HMP6]
MRKHILIILAIAVVLGGGAVWWALQPDPARLPITAVQGERPKISPARAQTIPTVAVADAIGWKNGATPVAAAGLKVAAFASGLEHPRWLYRLPNGDILVAETNSPPRDAKGIEGMVMGYLMKKGGAGVASPNRITLLRDTNGDGVAEAKTVLIGGLNSPTGMALMGGYLYIADTDALLRFPFTPGQTKIDAKPEKVIALNGGGNHWARTLLADPGGQYLYVGVGSATNIAEKGMKAEKFRANILQVDVKAKTFRVYGAGLRNPQGMAFEPKSGALWVAVNERDMLGSDIVPDYITRVGIGDHFGWPWYYWGGHQDFRVEPENPALQEYSKRPDFAMGPHVAALGLTFANDAKLGPNFANGAFVGEHGSWNRVPVSGYKVAYVPFGDRGFPVKGTKPVDVLTGFLNAKGEAQGRPVGVITDATGALLVADDVGNTIWRVSAK